MAQTKVKATGSTLTDWIAKLKLVGFDVVARRGTLQMDEVRKQIAVLEFDLTKREDEKKDLKKKL